MAIQAVLLDIDAYSHLFVRRNSNDPRVPRWREHLASRRVLIGFQTRAEILTGALHANWGERRMRALRETLDATPTVPADAEVIEAYARLTALCRQVGHGLQDRVHTGDRWIASCAIAKGLPLLADDGIYQGAANLALPKLT